MQLTIRILSVIIALAYLIAAALTEGWTHEIGVLVTSLTFALALIWLPEEIGDYPLRQHQQ